MQKQLHIWIWAILVLSLALHIYLQSNAEIKSRNEDPTNCILNYIESQNAYLENRITPLVLSNESESNAAQLQVDNDLAHKDLSLTVEIQDSIIYRSNSISGKTVCNVLIIEGPIKITRCVGIFSKEGELNQLIENNCGLVNHFKIVDNNSKGIPLFLDNKQIVIQGSQVDLSPKANWLLLPFFCSLILLLLWPFKYKIELSPILWYSCFILILGVYYLVETDIKFDWKLPIALCVLFANLFFWRNEYRFKKLSESKRLILHWAVILIPYLIASLCVWDTTRQIDINSPFESLSKINISDIGLIVSMVILMFAHLISMHQHWVFVKRKFKEGNKYMMLLVLLAGIHILCFYFIQQSFPIIPILLSILIYFLLVDLFSEGKQNPVLWAILWNVFLSIIISGAVYFGEFSSTVESIKKNIKQGHYESNTPLTRVYDIVQLPEYYKKEVSQFEDIGLQSFYKDSQIHFIDHKSNGNLHVLKFGIPGFIKAITLFSFVFIIGISGYFFLSLLHKKIKLLPRLFFPGENYLSSFSRRIQISYLILTVISFIGIAAITIILLNNYFKESERQALKNNLNLIRSQIEYVIQNNDSDIEKINTELAILENTNPFSLKIYSDEGININGKQSFLSTSVMRYLDNNQDGSLSELIDEEGYNSFLNLNHNNLKYAFISGIDQQGNASLSIYDFIAGILNVYVFLFIIAITFGLFVSKSIVDPLSRLSKEMKKLRLGKENEEIKWTGGGEVSELIENYNAMVRKLEDSANLIAHTERDMAWREMARQVAHEIKNPLTPMKLTLQYLQKQVEGGIIPDKAKIDRIANTLLEQIENLSNISDAFSNVAKLPKASNEKVILNEVVESVHDLFRKRDDMFIRLSEPINDMIVFADKNQLVRILNNIVKNAIEAIPESRHGEIEISLYKEANDAIIKVSDNGTGIPKSMQDKIFTPKFTTKNSGSGLGLAIAANMAESFNGRIYFNSTEGIGTDFFIQIPLMRLSENKDGNRVILD